MKTSDPRLPSLFLDRLKEILGVTYYEHYVNSFTAPRYTAFRVNTLKATRDQVLSQLLEIGLAPVPLDWVGEAFVIRQEDKPWLTASQVFAQGLIYIQNPSSMLASLTLDPAPEEEILDLAAAPGGKTLHIACLMQNTGRIAAVEVVKERFFKLRANILNAGASKVRPYLKDGSRVWRLVPERFDRVLLDAPCSSEGRFDPLDPRSYAYWSEKKIQEMSRKQKQLIYSAVKSLKPNGTLVYCTCSFAPEENEAIIQYALDKFPGVLKILPLPLNPPNITLNHGLMHWRDSQYSPDLVNAIRIIPDGLMAGFFICKLRKLQHT